MGKFRQVVELSFTMNKLDCLTRLINNNQYFIVTAYDIQGGHGLHLDSHALSEHLQCVVESFKYWHGDTYILRTLSLNYCRKFVNIINESQNEHIIQTKKCAWVQ